MRLLTRALVPTLAALLSFAATSAFAQDVTISGVGLDPSTVIGGRPSHGGVKLSGPAGANGFAVHLTSSNPVATVPENLVVPAGNDGAPFEVRTKGVDSPTYSIITASHEGVESRKATLVIMPANLYMITLKPTEVVGGNPVGATVALDGFAGPNGALIGLLSNNPDVATCDGSVRIEPGQYMRSFTVRTRGVDAPVTVTLSAKYRDVTKTASLVVKPAMLDGFRLVQVEIVGGNADPAVVVLNGQTGPSGGAVHIASNNAAAHVPEVVTIAPFERSKGFVVNTNAVPAVQYVSLTATFRNVTKMANLKILPAGMLSFVLDRYEVVGGATVKGGVGLSGPAPEGGVVVHLLSDKPGVAKVPETLTIEAGLERKYFPFPTFAVTEPTPVTITATVGEVHVSRVLNVLPARLLGLEFVQNPVVGGMEDHGVVSLNGPAPEGGLTVALTSENPALANVPASLNFAPGETRKYFLITTKGVAANTSVLISAKRGDATVSKPLYLMPARLDFVRAQESVVGGNPVRIYVALNGYAPAGGVDVTLSSNNAVLSVPATVHVPEGTRYGVVSGTTTAVNEPVQVTITAGFGGVTKTTIVTVKPQA